jgi:hypothetical protein
MENHFSRSSPAQDESARRSRWPWFFAASGVLVILIALFLPRPGNEAPSQADSKDSTASETTSKSLAGGRAGLWRTSQRLGPSATAEEIVTNKVNQFARNRRELVRAIASKFKVEVPDEVERFFEAVAAGRWDEVEGLAKALRENLRRSDDLIKLWPPIHETWGAIQEARDWPAQKLLDYGNEILGSLRPGMVYIGGTDPGRWIPTMLNETSESDRHVVLTQNAFADRTYLDYASFLYGVRLATLTDGDSMHAFQNYIDDARKRFDHDQQFPDEPRQLHPGEDVRVIDNRVQVSGQVAVMAINERLLQTLMTKNPDTTFAMEESFPLKSTYSGAAPLGPIMELRVNDGQNALTTERAAQSLDYWRATAQQLLADPEASASSATLNSYSKLAVGQANLFAERNFTAEAEQTYRVATEIQPANVEAVYGLSKILARTGRSGEASQMLDDFVLKYPSQRGSLEDLRKLHVPVTPAPAPP